MTLRVVKTGQEPILREAVDWLEGKGIPATCIRAVSMDAEIGQPMTITATFYVDESDEMAAQVPGQARCRDCKRLFPLGEERQHMHAFHSAPGAAS